MTNQYTTFMAYYLKAKDGLQTATKDGKEMKRVLGLFELCFFGMSAILGGGIFVVTGIQAKVNAGPAVMIAYLISGSVAALTALAYAEFASEVVITGGAFAYSTMMYGKCIGWFVGANVILEYLLAAATVAKGFSGYFTVLVGQPSGSLQFCIAFCEDESWAIVIDPVALACIIILTLVMVFGVKESFWFNAVTVVISLVAILVCIFAGAPHVENNNYTFNGFFPFGFRGVFSAASSVFFAYVGFDMIANGAEEAKNPNRDVPLATLICLAVCTLLYMAASTVIVGMVPYTDIDINAPFAVALQDVGYAWGGIIVSLGACAGTFNSAFAGIYAMSRLLVVMSRCNLAPPVFGKIHEKLKSPVLSTVVTGSIIAVLAFVVPLDVLADLVSMGTLVAFSLVDISVAVRARWQPGMMDNGIKLKLVLYTAIVYAGSILLAFSYYFQAPWWLLVAGAGVWMVGTGLFYTVPVIWRPAKYACPLNPILPAAGTLTCMFLLGTLGPKTWLPWLGSMIVFTLIYTANGFWQKKNFWHEGIEYEVVEPSPDSHLSYHSILGVDKSEYEPELGIIGEDDDEEEMKPMVTPKV